jgi:exodeoxyribonuclease-3
MKPLKLATFNINGVRKRLPILLEWLAREAPDIVCLQELKATDAAFPIAEIRAAGYGARWHGQQSWNGVAILARGADPLERRRGLPGDASDDQSRYIECAAHGLLVGCLYLPNGNPQPGPKFDYKLAWFERLIEHAAPLCSGRYPVVLAGDYNVVPTDFDIYDTRSWKKDALLQPESRECFRRLLGQGWTDALRTIHPEQIFTFWDYFRQHWQRNAGLRIDHLLLNPDLAPRLVDAGVDRWVRDLEGTSDHAPTWITLDMTSTPPTRRKPATAAPERADGTTARKTTKKVTAAPAKKATKKVAKKVAKAAPRAVSKKATGKTTGAPAKKSAARKKT